MKFYCIADEETTRGFQLAGIGTRVVREPQQAREAIDDAAAMPDCGIVIITERVADWVRPQIEAIRMEREHPLVVEIQGPEAQTPGRKSLRELVESAVGMSVY